MATPAPPTGGAVSDLRAAVDAYERQILSDTMARCRFNQKVAAEALGLSYDQIRHALKKHGLNN
jgi:psp operon transcriptional activator